MSSFSTFIDGISGKTGNDIQKQNIDAQTKLAEDEYAYKNTPEYRKQQIIYACMGFAGLVLVLFVAYKVLKGGK